MTDWGKMQENDLNTVMELPQGRRLVWDLIISCGVFDGGFSGNSTEFFKMGKRSVGLELHRRAKEICPALLRKAEDEYNESLRANQQHGGR